MADRECQIQKARDLKDAIEGMEARMDVLDVEIEERNVTSNDLKRQLEEIKQQLAIVEQEIHVRQEEHRQIETTLHNKQTDYLQMLEAQPALLGVLKRK